MNATSTTNMNTATWLRRNKLWVIPLCVFVLLRIPSFIEPLWYSDEAGYATTVWLVHLGYGLYVNAWNNKPPLLYDIIGIVIHTFGANEAALHLESFITGGAALGASIWGFSKLCGKRIAFIFGIILAIVLGGPYFDAELAMPESFLIAPQAIAGTLFLLYCIRSDTKKPTMSMLILIGVMLSFAVLIQQTALADVGVIVLWCLVRNRWRELLTIACTVGISIVAVIAPYIARSGFHNVYFALVSSYVTYVNNANSLELFKYLTWTFRIIIVVAIVLTTWWNRRAKHEHLEFARLWCTALLFVAIAPGYPYEHFLLPVCIPALFFIGLYIADHKEDIFFPLKRVRVRIATAVVVLLTLVAIPTFSQQYGGLYHLGWSFDYYPVMVGYELHIIPESSFYNYFGVEGYGELLADEWIAQHHLTHTTGTVWGTLAWPIVINNWIPPTRSGPFYVTVHLENGTADTLSRMTTNPPEVILASTWDLTPRYLRIVQQFAHSHHYTEVMNKDLTVMYVLHMPKT